jgi:membrane-bound serine protease (ClpP class)
MFASMVVWAGLTSALCGAVVQDERQDGVVVTSIRGGLEEGMIPTLQRAVRRALELRSSTLILELDTPGGAVDIMGQLGDLLRTPGLTSIAYVTREAGSAGAYLVLSCDRVYTAEHAAIGSAYPIVLIPGLGIATDIDPKIVEKQVSFLRAKFRDAAQGHDKPGLDALAQAFVDPSVGVVLASTPTGDRILSAREFEDLAAVSGPGQVRLLKTICDEGNLLALSAAEAFDYGLSDGIVTQRDELLEALKLSGTPVVEVHASWSELFVNQLGGLVRYVLFGLGALLLLLELKSPGFGLLGIAGLLLVGTVFFRNYLAGLADMPELLLIVLGLVLLALELFVIPGFGITGFLGITAIVLGAIFSFLPFLFPQAPSESDYLRDVLASFGGMMVGTVAAIFPLSRWILPRLPWFKAMTLAGTETVVTPSGALAQPQVGATIGTRGTAFTPLRPAGKVDLGGAVFDARSDGAFIERGAPIVVVSVESNHVVVRTAEEA